MNTNLEPTVKQKPAIFAGILCILYPIIQMLCRTYYYVQILENPHYSAMRSNDLLSSIANLCIIVLGILLFLKKPNVGHTIVLGAYMLYRFVNVIQNLLGFVYTANASVLVSVLFSLIDFAAMGLLFVLSIFANRRTAHPGAAKLWIVSLILEIVYVAYLIGYCIIQEPQALILAISLILFVIIVALVGKWLARYAAAGTSTYADTYTTANNTTTPAEDGYIDMVHHVLLMLLIGGIWQYVWIYKTTKALNRTPGAEERNPTTKLLLCMFVPFYYLYWVYQSAQRIDTLAKSKNLTGDCATLSLILAIFLGIVAPIFMQYKLNEVCKTSAAAPAPAPTAAPAEDAADQIKKYKDLLDCGAITEEEYNEKKKQLLGL